MITLKLGPDHAREVLLAVQQRSRTVGCGLCQRMLNEVSSALKEFVLLAAGEPGVPAEGCRPPEMPPEKTAGPRVENRGSGN